MDEEHEPTFVVEPFHSNHALRFGWWRFLNIEEINESIAEAIARLDNKETISKELGLELYDVVAVKLKDRNCV
jgi:hypothetical protein